MSGRTLERACFSCGGTEGTVLFEQRFASMPGASVVDGYDVVACEACGTCFADRVPAQDAFDRYYRELSKYENPTTAGRESDADRLRFADVARELRPVLDTRARILEIGCAGGGLLGALKELGIADVHGVDPSPHCAAAAAHNHGVDARAGTLWRTGFEGETFDLVILIAVLEHVRDVARAMSSLSGLVREGGLLHLEVPDASRFTEHSDVPFQQFSVEHINYFTPASLARLAAAWGFEPVQQNRAIRQVGRRALEPVVTATFRRTGVRAEALGRDETGPQEIARYVALSTRREEPIRARVSALANDRRPVLVWSAGTQCLRLLATSELGRARIEAFVDSNPRYAGRSLLERPVIGPSQLAGRAEPIVIASTNYQREIAASVRDVLRLPNELVLLAPDEG